MTPEQHDHEQPLRPGGLSAARAPVTVVSHQTVRLTKGKHSSPTQGVCVMELASMLAGEPFSDNPVSVCPVIASFLRAYNDSIDDARRQDLYTYASKVVGSRASEAVERARAERLAAWAMARRRRAWTRPLAIPALRRLGVGRKPPFQTPGLLVVQALRRHTDQTHADVLALIDELLALDLCQAAAARAGAATVESGAAAGDAPTGHGERERAALALLRERHTVT